MPKVLVLNIVVTPSFSDTKAEDGNVQFDPSASSAGLGRILVGTLLLSVLRIDAELARGPRLMAKDGDDGESNV